MGLHDFRDIKACPRAPFTPKEILFAFGFAVQLIMLSIVYWYGFLQSNAFFINRRWQFVLNIIPFWLFSKAHFEEVSCLGWHNFIIYIMSEGWKTLCFGSVWIRFGLVKYLHTWRAFFLFLFILPILMQLYTQQFQNILSNTPQVGVLFYSSVHLFISC